MAETHSAESQIKDAAWTYGGWFVLLALTLGAGIALGYIFWGDAAHLRTENTELNQKLLVARSDRENEHHQLVAAQEEVGRCQRKLDATGAAGGAAAGGAAPAAPAAQ
jgi:uncharacterized protein HemX